MKNSGVNTLNSLLASIVTAEKIPVRRDNTLKILTCAPTDDSIGWDQGLTRSILTFKILSKDDVNGTVQGYVTEYLDADYDTAIMKYGGKEMIVPIVDLGTRQGEQGI